MPSVPPGASDWEVARLQRREACNTIILLGLLAVAQRIAMEVNHCEKA